MTGLLSARVLAAKDLVRLGALVLFRTLLQSAVLAVL